MLVLSERSKNVRLFLFQFQSLEADRVYSFLYQMLNYLQDKSNNVYVSASLEDLQ